MSCACDKEALFNSSVIMPKYSKIAIATQDYND